MFGSAPSMPGAMDQMQKQMQQQGQPPAMPPPGGQDPAAMYQQQMQQMQPMQQQANDRMNQPAMGMPGMQQAAPSAMPSPWMGMSPGSGLGPMFAQVDPRTQKLQNSVNNAMHLNQPPRSSKPPVDHSLRTTFTDAIRRKKLGK